jgi:VanZ family protein
MQRRLAKYLLIALLLYWAAMFVATHVPGSKIPEETFGFDKVVHFTAYAALAWLAATLLHVLGWWNWKTAMALVVVAAIYGGIDEWLQPYFDRNADIDDWIADMIGVAFGLAMFRFVWPAGRRRRSREVAVTSPRPPTAS